jgi:hypothetical protein
MYRITYEQGNGYHCGCCRRTWTSTVDLETEEQVLEWLEELQACYRTSQYEDDDDRSVESIEKEIGVDIQSQFVPRKEKVDAIVAKRNKKKEDDKIEAKKEEELREYRKFIELQEKFKNK